MDNSLQIPVQQLDTDTQSKCQRCLTSKCCQYTTVAIDTPRSMRDFDTLLWQISHQNVHIFKDTNGWYLLFNQVCQHLSPSGFCQIYDKRPLICREHDNEHCEFDLDYNQGCELYFTTYEEFSHYCEQRFRRWAHRFD